MKLKLATQAAITERLSWRHTFIVVTLLLLSAGIQAAKPPTAGPAKDADLAMVKTVDNPNPRAGDTIIYTLTLTNNGPNNANNIVVNDRLPIELTYVSHLGAGTYDPVSGDWTPGVLMKAGDVVQLTITATVNLGIVEGTITTNTATLTASNAPDSVPGNNSSSAAVTVVAPNLTILKSVQTTSDPINGATSPFNIPGATVLYSLQATNSGLGSPDVDTVVMVDPIPANTDLFVGDLGGAGSGPVLMIDGAVASGLSYTFTGLASITDDLEFSNDNGATWIYTPVPDIDGYDAAVTNIRINPKGVMNTSGASFTLRFRVRVL